MAAAGQEAYGFRSGYLDERSPGAEGTLSRDLNVFAKIPCLVWVPGSCEGRRVICQERFSRCVGWSRQISPPGICVSHLQTDGSSLCAVSSCLSKVLGGWDNHGQQATELHNGERQCGEIWAAGTRNQVAPGGRHAGFGAICKLLALLILTM